MGDGTEKKPYTREDVIRLIKENGDTAEGLDLSRKWFEAYIDLSKLDLQGIILKVAALGTANLKGSDLRNANLERAFLVNTILENTLLADANLEKVLLVNASLEGADLSGVNLKEANLVGAYFKGAQLVGSNLKGADLSKAHLEGVRLHRAQFDNTTNFQGINWGKDYKIGEELDYKFDWAVDEYSRLKAWYTQSGYHGIAARFYYREKEAGRKSLKWHSKAWNHRLGQEILRLLFAYGEDWKPVVGWIAAVIFGLAIAYWLWGSFDSSSFWDTLYYSATSFSALGYGSWAPQPTGWAKGAGAVEAIIGVAMMALFLVTFVRKWTR